MAEMPNLKLSEEVHPNTELQPRRHPVAPLRLDRDTVVEFDPGDAAQPEGESEAVAEPHLAQELLGRNTLWGGEVPDVAGGEEGVRAEEVSEAAPVRPQRQGRVEVEAGRPVGGATNGVAVRGGAHAAHL